MVLVLTLLSHGCPTQAIVAAFGLDERTVARWCLEAGRHCQRVHEHVVEQGQVDLRHVQADELWVKQVGGKVWMALALAVPSRLWLVDGFQLAQVIKHSAKRHVVGVTRRVIHGTLARIEAVLTATATGTVINTAYIERLNATFRAHLAPLARRGRAIARTEAALTAGMWLVGTAYNFCWPHDSLRLLAPPGAPRKWLQRTPAMAAGLTDSCWTLDELLRFQIPLPRWVAPKRRGRPPKRPPLGAAA